MNLVNPDYPVNLDYLVNPVQPMDLKGLMNLDHLENQVLLQPVDLVDPENPLDPACLVCLINPEGLENPENPEDMVDPEFLADLKNPADFMNPDYLMFLTTTIPLAQKNPANPWGLNPTDLLNPMNPMDPKMKGSKKFLKLKKSSPFLTSPGPNFYETFLMPYTIVY